MTTPPPSDTPADLFADQTARAGSDNRADDTDLATGLTTAEAQRRLAAIGPNVLAEPPAHPLWRRALSALSDRMVLVLLAAAVVSAMVEQELKTPLVIVAVVLVNTAIGLIQEGRAGRALESLRAMTADQARVRREARVTEIPSRDLVPGDVVLLDGGDRVPADGRVMVSRQLEIDESALTGESRAVEKADDVAVADDAPLGDRTDLAFMHTSVTRGRGEIVVTRTGMQTEIGRIAGLLGTSTPAPTPLQRQLHQLAGRLALLAGAVIAVVMALGLLRGRSFGEVFANSVALAVASIPEGLPAVTAVTLALGVQRMAQHNAIVKRLAAVETLGSTTVICTDKTGTLTENKMTARVLVHGVETITLDGTATLPDRLHHVADAAVLCSDAAIHVDPGDGATTMAGDPTETALFALARGRDVSAIRSAAPRLAEVPFESSAKFMATLHEVDGHGLLIAKGAFDVLLPRCTNIDMSGPGRPRAVEPLTDPTAMHAAHDELADDGVRVIALAARTMDPAEVGAETIDDEVHDLTLLGLVGIVDPPRAEAREAIATARTAGIEIRMITGDHAVTAAAIGRELGLVGRAVTGTEIDRAGQIPTDAAVYARVSPEHKLRLVEALQAEGHVVAMTGDGVNDAPALERADMGVAMGITGTDVSKQAASMVLADDDISTIVRAVEEGRTIYDGIVHFVRFQLSTSLGFAVLFLLAAALGVGTAAPFSAVAILWVNLIMDGPPAMALGVDPPESDTMRRPPRPPDEPILTRRRWTTIALAATVMALGTLAVLAWAPTTPGTDGVTSATAMAFTTFVLFQVFNLMNSRSDHATVFSRRTLRNRWLWGSLALVLALQVVVVHAGPAQRFVGTTSLTATQWLVCAAVASVVLWVEELRKLLSRRSVPNAPSVS